MSTRFTLVTSIPPFSKYTAARVHELLQALRLNALSPFIGSVVLLCEEQNATAVLGHLDFTSKAKITLLPRNSQSSYAELFAAANAATPRGGLAIVTHSDIYFDLSLHVVPALVTSSRVILALSRHPSPYCPKASALAQLSSHRQAERNLCEFYTGSHDVFMFSAPADVALDGLQFAPNRQGAENVLISRFKNASYTVLNPCLDVHALHMHCTNERDAPSKKELHMVYAQGINMGAEHLARSHATWTFHFSDRMDL